MTALLDCSPLIACVALFGIAVGAVCYTLGHIHGFEDGADMVGCELRRFFSKRIMRAKRNAHRAGRRFQEVTTITPRRRKPGTSNSPAPAMRGAL